MGVLAFVAAVGTPPTLPGVRIASCARTSRDWQAEIQADQQRAAASLHAYFQTDGAQQVLDRAAFLNSLIDERSFPWTKIFMDLEETLPPGVRVVSISPKLVNGRAEVAAGGRLPNPTTGKIQFLEAIEKSKVFSGLVSDRRAASR